MNNRKAEIRTAGSREEPAPIAHSKSGDVRDQGAAVAGVAAGRRRLGRADCVIRA